MSFTYVDTGFKTSSDFDTLARNMSTALGGIPGMQAVYRKYDSNQKFISALYAYAPSGNKTGFWMDFAVSGSSFKLKAVNNVTLSYSGGVLTGYSYSLAVSDYSSTYPGTYQLNCKKSSAKVYGAGVWYGTISKGSVSDVVIGLYTRDPDTDQSNNIWLDYPVYFGNTYASFLEESMCYTCQLNAGAFPVADAGETGHHVNFYMSCGSMGEYIQQGNDQQLFINFKFMLQHIHPCAVDDVRTNSLYRITCTPLWGAALIKTWPVFQIGDCYVVTCHKNDPPRVMEVFSIHGVSFRVLTKYAARGNAAIAVAVKI